MLMLTPDFYKYVQSALNHMTRSCTNKKNIMIWQDYELGDPPMWGSVHNVTIESKNLNYNLNLVEVYESNNAKSNWNQVQDTVDESSVYESNGNPHHILIRI